MTTKRITPLDMAKQEIRNVVIQVLASAPSSPVAGLIYYDSTDTTLYYYSGSAWVAAKSGAPSGSAGGSLTGTYPNPTIAALAVTASMIANATITDTQIAAANKDGSAGVASLRTLGTGSAQATAGNDARLSDTRTPTDGTVTGGTSAGAGVKIAAATVTDFNVAAANKDGVAGTASMRTLGTGSTQAAAGNDARFTDSRTPNGSAGGNLTGSYPNPTIAAGVVTDTMVAAANKDGSSGTASMRTLGTGAAQACAGNDARLSDTRTPTAGSITDSMVAGGAAIAFSKLAAPVGAFAFGSQRLTSVADPTSAQDAATKAYVDAARQGLDAKDSVVVATTGNVALTGAQTIDGISVANGSRVAVVANTTASENGIYVTAAGAWTRAVDADASGEISPGSIVYVESGTANGAQQWVVTATGASPWVPGSSTSTWSQFTGVSATSAGAGLVKSGNTFAVGAGTGITVNADDVAINTALVARKYVAAITGTNGSTETVTHNLGQQWVSVTLRDSSGNRIDCDDVATNSNTVTLNWGVAPGTGCTVTIIG